MTATAPVQRAWPRSALDAGLAAATLAATLMLLFHGGIMRAHVSWAALDAAGAVLAVCSTLPLAAWRRSPTAIFIVTMVPSVLLAGLGYPADVIIGPTAALYLLAASRTRRAPWTVSLTALVAGLFLAYLAAAALARQAFPAVELMHTGLAFAGAWFAGERTRLRREQIAGLRARALRAEQDSELQRQLAVAGERTRIARDLHDSAGHAINVIAVRAGAARLHFGQDPRRSLASIEAIEQLARQTAGQIDQIIGGLRDTAAVGGVAVPAGVASLDTLIAQHTSAGLSVTTELSGPVPEPGTPADQAVFRILQEALTNAGRHGDGRVHVNVTFGGTLIEVTVTNPVGSPAKQRPGGGHGLIGMRERLTLLGGTLRTIAADGQFLMKASIPVTGPAS